jgi:CBS domain containing-hemolysin-like protein
MNPDSYPAEPLTALLNITPPTGSFAPLITYTVLALVISHICSVLESVLLSTPLSFINNLEQQNVPGAARLKKMKSEIDRPISSILVINTIANTVGASLVGSEAALLFSSTGVGIVSAVFTFCVLLFSEIIPKTIGSTYWRQLALPASKVIRAYIFITYPLVLLIERVTRFISNGSSTVSMSREEVAAVVTTGAEEGVLEKEENKMIQNLLKLDQFTAHEIMTPSSVVTMAERQQTIREFYQSDDFGTFSRIPLYDADNDEYVTGYVLKQEILERMARDEFNTKLAELERPILTFSEDESVSNIWERLLEKKEHISVVIDEYGSMRGLVTMEDCIETMLGTEIVDEKDEVVDMQELAKAQWKQVQREQQKARGSYQP